MDEGAAHLADVNDLFPQFSLGLGRWGMHPVNVSAASNCASWASVHATG